MGNSPIEERIFLRGNFIGMRIEIIAGKFCKVIDIIKRHLPGFRVQRIAKRELFERFSKRMNIGLGLRAATNPAIAVQESDHARRRRTLQ